MHLSWRSGLLFVAVVVAGCGKPGNPAAKPAKSTAANSAGSECVVGVEGMSWRSAWTAAVAKAIAALPWVEKDSVSVDFDSQEAHFNLKKGATFDRDELKKAIDGSRRGTMGEVKRTPK